MLDRFRILHLLLLIGIPLASFLTGLRSTDPFWLWKQPRLLGRALLSILVVVPVVTALLLPLLSPANLYVRAGIMISVLSIGIGPLDLLRRTHAGITTVRYEVGLDVTLLALAIIFMPLAVALHDLVFHHTIHLSWLQVAQVVLQQAMLPFLAGLAVARLFPKVVTLVCRHAERFVTIIGLVVIAAALIVAGRALIDLGLAAWLTCAAVAIVSILTGHVLGGPRLETRAGLAGFSAIRFHGLALLLVSVVPHGKVLIPVIVAYVITSTVLVGVYRAAIAKDLEAEEMEA